MKYTDEQLEKGLKKYQLKRYKNNVGKYIGGFVYFHKMHIDAFPEFADNIKEKASHVPKDFHWNCIKYNVATGVCTFINSPNFDTSDEPQSGDNYTVFDNGVTKYYKAPASPLIWHHKWLWVKDDYPGFNVRESKERSLFWNEQLENHEDPKIKSKIGYAKVWDELPFNRK